MRVYHASTGPGCTHPAPPGREASARSDLDLWPLPSPDRHGEPSCAPAPWPIDMSLVLGAFETIDPALSLLGRLGDGEPVQIFSNGCCHASSSARRFLTVGASAREIDNGSGHQAQARGRGAEDETMAATVRLGHAWI